MNILLLSHVFSPNLGGVETHLDDLCRYLSSRGHTVFVITLSPQASSHSYRKAEYYAGLEIRRVPWLRFRNIQRFAATPLEFLYYFPPLFLYSVLFVLPRRRMLDVIHAHGLVSSSAATILAWFLRRKSVTSIHWIPNVRGRHFIRFLLRSILSVQGKILTVSKAARLDLAKAGVPLNKMEVFRYWVDQTIFRPLNKSACKKRIDCRNRFVVLFVGRLIEEKGILLLMDVAKSLENQDDLRFVIAGDGPLGPTVRKVATRFSNISYVGPVRNRDLPELYNAADVVVVPSLHEEGYGRVIVEALSCQVPVIASKRGGIPEAVDSTVAMLVEPTAEALLTAIRSLHSSPSMLRKMSSRCLDYARTRFSEANAAVIESSLMSFSGNPNTLCRVR